MKEMSVIIASAVHAENGAAIIASVASEDTGLHS